MKISKIETDFPLDAQGIDLVSEKIRTFLEAVGTERRNVVRLCLSVEDMLLQWKEHFGENAVLHLTAGTRFARPFVNLELAGESYDPLNREDEFGEISTRMLGNMGLYPTYQYAKGVNTVTIRLKRKHINPLTGLLFAVVAAALLGWMGMLLPTDLRNSATELLLTPVYETFLGILGTVAGPMIFLSVSWGIYGIGDAALLGRIGKKMLLRFVGMTALVTGAALAILTPFSGLQFTGSGIDASGFQGILELILGIFPRNIISPFLDGNTMQIILIATVVGCIMLILGSQTKMVALFIEQINYIIQYLMELISTIVPAFIFIVILRLLWSGSVLAIFTAWKPLAYFVSVTLLVSMATILYVSLKEKISPIRFARKIFPPFLIAFTTASSSASFGSNIYCCERELGIDPKVSNFGIPLSIVLYKPITSISFVACALYFANYYHVAVSAVWVATALLVITVVTVALPPIPGGAIACYTIVFLQLGIPVEALGVVLVLDVVVDFICTGFDLIMRQCELVLEADKVQMLNRDILQK